MVSYLAEAPEEVVRYTSIVRAVEAAGGAVACTYHQFLRRIEAVLHFYHSWYQLDYSARGFHFAHTARSLTTIC